MSAEPPIEAHHLSERLLLEDIPIGVFITALDGTILDANETLLEIMGYDSRAEFLETNVESHYDDPEERERLIAEVRHRGIVRGFEMRARRRDGSGAWFRVAARLVTDTDESPRLVGFIEDVTAEVETASELADLTTRIEQRNQDLDRFASVAAHDLKQPLRKIQAFANMLEDNLGELDQRSASYLGSIHSAADRLRHLIDSLLTLSRVGRVADGTLVDLHEATQGALEDLGPVLEDTGASFDIGDLTVIEADRSQMRQLFTNLFSNSVKFSGDGVKTHVVVRAVMTEDNGTRWCELSVADNGVGFSPELADRVFQPFEQLATQAQPEGVGLGLAICRRIVTAHSGTIAVTTTPGDGATFTIRLPIAQGKQED